MNCEIQKVTAFRQVLNKNKEERKMLGGENSELTDEISKTPPIKERKEEICIYLFFGGENSKPIYFMSNKSSSFLVVSLRYLSSNNFLKRERNCIKEKKAPETTHCNLV